MYSNTMNLDKLRDKIIDQAMKGALLPFFIVLQVLSLLLSTLSTVFLVFYTVAVYNADKLSIDDVNMLWFVASIVVFNYAFLAAEKGSRWLEKQVEVIKQEVYQ